MSNHDNLWRTTAQHQAPERSLDRTHTCGVAIIGGGFTGLSAALHLAQAGVDVCLLESHSIGQGGSGRNVGLVNAGLWKPPEAVNKTLGPAAGEHLTRQLSEGPKLVFELIEQHQITCEAIQKGTLHCAHDAHGWRDLQNRHRQQVARGAPVELLSAQQASERTGSHRFHGALRDTRAGTIQPLSFAKGLAAAASAAGAQIYEHSPVHTVRFDGNQWQLETASGQITAERLIQATNAYDTTGLPPNAYVPVHYFQCATKPLPAELRETILPGGEGCWDTAQVMSSFRLDLAGRMVIGAIGSLEGFGAGIHRRWARRKMAQLYPQLAGNDFQYSWCGRIAMTADYLPKVVDIGTKAISIYGYSGRGIGPGTLFGKCTVDWVAGRNPAAFPVAITAASNRRFSAAKAVYFELGASLTHLVKTRGF